MEVATVITVTSLVTWLEIAQKVETPLVASEEVVVVVAVIDHATTVARLAIFPEIVPVREVVAVEVTRLATTAMRLDIYLVTVPMRDKVVAVVVAAEDPATIVDVLDTSPEIVQMAAVVEADVEVVVAAVAESATSAIKLATLLVNAHLRVLM